MRVKTSFRNCFGIAPSSDTLRGATFSREGRGKKNHAAIAPSPLAGEGRSEGDGG